MRRLGLLSLQRGAGPQWTGEEHNGVGLETSDQKKKEKFSVVKAVKANARERLGQPKAERVIEDKPRTEKRAAKHKQSLGEMLAEDSQ